ncbi:MAG: CDGSH iron-sulfur domain-containing protein [Pseudomonadota bacterium]|nr:CDGSH iron-sulfur domain-containing protein [Pseudomonadota bacterium]MDE3037902.1 CDGSH iron-sulfur domain-containing protein [Pseudomonadota bacterium]
MSSPRIAQKSPYPVEVTEGKNYAWCACGRSQKQPFCDGSHKDTGLTPTVWKAPKTETVWLCGCKKTKGKPFCDGTHEAL